MKFDKVDLNILSILQENGRITKVKLAEKANLSASACYERLCRLENARLISNYRAEVDVQRIMKTDIVVVQLVLKNHRYADFQLFEQYVKKVPQIIECLAVTGGFDYMLKFSVTNMTHYQEVFDELLQANIGIDRYFTYVVIKPVTPFRGFPLHDLMDRAQHDINQTEPFSTLSTNTQPHI